MEYIYDSSFKILKTELHVWLIKLDEISKSINYLKAILTEDEILKASKFRFHKDKNCSIISRGALRLLTSKYLNTNPKTITFKYGDYGKPYYSIETDLKFNVSHSGNLAIIGFVLNNDIGVDIEQLKYDFDVMDIVDNYFSQHEIETLKKFPNQELTQGFYRCWTRKESFIKAKAKGLSFPLDSFSVDIKSDEKTELLETKWDKNEKDLWRLFSFSPMKNYVGAVSVKGNIQSVKHFNFDEIISK
jgi:4'-phosphopantetheinyl transferase